MNAYDEYGVPGVPNLGRFQYTGQMWLPEAQLYHYKARAYLPALGRFAQTDPVLFAGGVNLYAYVGNDPVNATDPLGLQSQPPECRDEPGDNECTITVTASGDNCRFPLCVNDPQAIDALVDRFGTTVQQTGEDEITVTGRRRCDRACVTRQQEELQQWMRDNSLRLFGEGMSYTWLNGVPLPRFGIIARLCGCFVEGTQVMTPEGLVAIEDIQVGDEVLAWNPETGETSTQTVTALIRPEPKLIWRLETRDAGGETEVFEATADHPWYVEGAGWVETQALRPGQRIETADDRGLLILHIARTDRVERTFNLEVSGPHTFLVGEDGAVVHNGPCDRFLGYAANNIRHIFAGKHQLGSLVSRYGSQRGALTALQNAAQNSLSPATYATGSWVTINVGGANVAVRGAFVNGTFRIGTATMAPWP